MDLLERTGNSAQRHPWEAARLHVIERLVQRAQLDSPRVLEVGCGDGFVIRGLRERMSFSRAVGLDVHLTDRVCEELSSPDVDLVATLPVASENRFELLLLLDVIEHLEKPEPFLRDLVRERLEAGGFAVVTVPAFQSLYSHHDRELRHFRRYASSELVREVESAGLTVVASGYFFASLLLPRILEVVRERWRGEAVGRVAEGTVGVGGWSHGSLASRFLVGWLRADAGLCLAATRAGVRIPGLSAWTVCRKPSS